MRLFLLCIFISLTELSFAGSLEGASNDDLIAYLVPAVVLGLTVGMIIAFEFIVKKINDHRNGRSFHDDSSEPLENGINYE